MGRQPAKLAALSGTGLLATLLAVFVARPARAADGPCPSVEIETDASVRGLWPEAAERLHQAFDARDDIDGCARVRLRRVGARIAVDVVLPDGRSASRLVAGREDVVPTLEALLLVVRLPPHVDVAAALEKVPGPSSAPSAPSSSPAILESVAPPSVATPSTVPLADRDGPVRLPPVSPGRLGIELSAVTAARIGDGQSSVGVGASSFLDVAGWLVGFEGRVDRYQRLGAGAPPTGALELALLAGRRIRFGTLALDLHAGPALAVPGGTGTSVTRTAACSASSGCAMTIETSSSHSGGVPRLVFGARLGFRARSVLRTFVGVDAEVGPAGGAPADAAPPTDRYLLPLWTVGLALGATVGTR